MWASTCNARRPVQARRASLEIIRAQARRGGATLQGHATGALTDLLAGGTQRQTLPPLPLLRLLPPRRQYRRATATFGMKTPVPPELPSARAAGAVAGGLGRACVCAAFYCCSGI